MPPAVGAAPVVPAAWVVACVPDAQSGPILKPLGSVAVALVPMPSKFSVTAVPVVLIEICANNPGHAINSIPISSRYNFLIACIKVLQEKIFIGYSMILAQVECATSLGFCRCVVDAKDRRPVLCKCYRLPYIQGFIKA